MEVITITGDNALDFSDYISEDILSFLDREFFRGLGVVDNYLSPVGAIVYELMEYDSEKDIKSRIYSFKVEGDEVADLIMSQYREDVGEENVVESLYEFADEETEHYFKHYGFESERMESIELQLSAKDIKSIVEKNGTKKIPSYIKSLSEISPLQYREYLKKLLVHGQFGILEDLAYLPVTWFDGDVSFCSMADGKIDGIFLIRRLPSGTLLPCLFTSFGIDSRNNLGFLMFSAIQRVAEKCEDGTKVIIRRRNTNVRSLTDKLFPGKKGPLVFIGKRAEGEVS